MGKVNELKIENGDLTLIIFIIQSFLCWWKNISTKNRKNCLIFVIHLS